MSDRFTPHARIFALLLMPLLTAPVLHAQAPKSEPSPGRESLNKDLNTLAARETAGRRAKVDAISTKAAAEARQREVRATMLRLLGPLPERTPLNAQVTGSTQLEGFRVDRVLYESQPKFYVTALLYVPDRINGGDMSTKFPAVVMTPGHAPTGKAGDVAFAEAFARAGFVVLSWDPFGQGERLQYPDREHEGKTLAKAPTGEHGEAGLQPALIGNAIAQYMLWDGMRAVDYLTSLPEVDPKRIGAFGCSGGGTDTALLGALDTRVAAIGVACYITSFDALLPSLGPQDAEQSIPNFIASGLDLPDWVEVAAPRPYAIVSTTEDMFPFAGATTSEAEARKFYAHLGADKDLANLVWIKGPGRHGNLRPVLPQVLAFFTAHLHPDAAYAKNLPPITDPFTTQLPAVKITPPDPKLTQVTPTGQVATSYPDAATVFTLNKARAEKIVTPHPKTLIALQHEIREVTHASVLPADCDLQGFLGTCPLPSSGKVRVEVRDLPPENPASKIAPDSVVTFTYPGGSSFHALFGTGVTASTARVALLLSDDFDVNGNPGTALLSQTHELNKQGSVVFAMQPRPSPRGTEESKAGILGDFYLTELRAELAGRTLLGLRVDDLVTAVNYLNGFGMQKSNLTPKHPQIAAEASGHYALVLLHGAVLDTRLKSVLVLGEIINYRDLIADPMPKNAPEDILPGVLKHYDVDDLRTALGTRLERTSAP